MPPPIALVTATILWEPACLGCITKLTHLSDAQVDTALAHIRTLIVLHQNNGGRCHQCGNVRAVVSLKPFVTWD